MVGGWRRPRLVGTPPRGGKGRNIALASAGESLASASVAPRTLFAVGTELGARPRLRLVLVEKVEAHRVRARGRVRRGSDLAGVGSSVVPPRFQQFFFFFSGSSILRSQGRADLPRAGSDRYLASCLSFVASEARCCSPLEASHLARASALSRDSVRSRAPSRGTPARARVPFLSPTRRRWGCLDARCYARGTAPAPRLGAPSRSRASPS